ncbi:hypothetical protein [Bdellovibrio bacteriovorus]|uniref:hypothetical protein n=1 Tax=Bdellovibrio bacteriovorus TaxID=959 RepID=UPI003D04EF63
MKCSLAHLAILCLIIFSGVQSYGKCSKALRISVAESWPPQVLRILDGFKQPFKDIGCEVIFKKVPLSRSLLLVSKHELDGDTFRIAGFENEIPHLLRVQTPMARLKYYFYKNAGSRLNLEQPKTLRGRKTCLTLGNRLRSQVAKELQLEVLEASNTVQCLRMLATGRIDVFFGPIIEVQDPALKQYNETLIRANRPYTIANLYIYLNDNHKKVAEKLEPILGKYFISDDAPPERSL